MATGSTARMYHQDMVHYVVAPIVYTTLSYTIGTLPAGALITDAFAVITTPFAGGTPQTLDIGVGADTVGLATALVITAAGKKAADEIATSDDLYLSAATTVNATLSAGATTSAGAGYVVVQYIMANRGL